MAVIPNYFMESVVTISVMNHKNEKKCIGTGFLVGDLMCENSTTKKYGLYLITNKHVIDNKKQIYVGFNQRSSFSGIDFPINIVIGNQKFYSEHINQDVDIIAISINASALNNNNVKYSFFRLESDAYTIYDMSAKEVYEGDLVYSLGYPLYMGDLSQKYPICRSGCISKISNLFLPGNPEVNFLVDAQSFPGNSGGPVILRPELMSIIGSKSQPQAALIGILHKYIPYCDELYSLQTGLRQSIVQENSGLTLVHPVDFIKNVVQLERQRVGDNNISMYEMIISNEQSQLENKEEDSKLEEKDNDVSDN